MPVRKIGPSGRLEVRNAGENTAELLIYGDIGESFWGEESITAKQVVDDLKSTKAEYLTVRINSGGGSVHDALAIYNAIRRHPSAVTVEIDGIAASAASLIAMSGDTIRSASNALLMIHAPWAGVAGNATQLRTAAEMLDKHAEAMSTAYAREGVSAADALALLSDGEDHWFTAEEALAAGYIDSISDAFPIAASLRKDCARFFPAAVAALPPEPPMADENNDGDDLTEIQSAAMQKERDRIQARNALITTSYSRHADHAGVGALLAAQLSDPEITVEQAQASLLDHLAQPAAPIAGPPNSTTVVLDARDKYKAGVSAALAVRIAGAKDDRGNEFRGMALHQLAAASMKVSGANISGLTKSEIAGKVLAAHSTSDFPYLLQDAANKKLQAAYEAFPATWRSICAVGEVSDFKTINLVRLGSFNSLDTILEGAEYTQGSISEEREQLTAATKGKFIQLTRQMIVNDDLSGFSRIAGMLGNAAGRTVNKDVYALINANAAMSDSVSIFHADHANLAGSGAAISVATLGAGRTAMRKQQDPGGHDYLNIQPRTLLTPVVLEDHARDVVTNPYNVDTTSSRKNNPIRSWAPLDVVSDPYLDATSATAWYLIADPMDAPLIEVHFLDGQQTPFIDTEEEFLTDAIRWKVRLDYGLAANDYRGGFRNAGA